MISYIDYYVPEERLSVESVFNSAGEKSKLPASFETKEDGISFFKNVIGLHEVSYENVMSETELSDILLNRFFDADLVAPSKIDMLILIGDELNKGTRIDNLGHYIQYNHMLENADVCIQSGNHCSNVEYAVSYAESLLKSGDLKHIIILAVNKLIRHEERIIGSYAIQGDGAGILYLNANETGGIKICGKQSFTKGILYMADVNADNSLLLCKNYMVCLSVLMKRFSLKAVDISHVIIQNANHLLITQCLNSLGFETEQIFAENLTSYGHLDAIDFIVNLKSLKSGMTEVPSKIISFGTGWAGSYIALYMEII